MILGAEERLTTGLDTRGLVEEDHGLLLPDVARAFAALRAAAAEAGFDLRAASTHRSFERQRQIWNGKLRGERVVLDDADRPVPLADLDPHERLLRVLRFSALPGTSRHHWGTDLDVFDAGAMPPGYRLALSRAEVADDGLFGPLHQWLDRRIETGDSFGFYRPYDRDRGGVSPERWHLSFAPAAHPRAGCISAELLFEAWDLAERQAPCERGLPYLEGRADVEARIGALLERFVERVAPPPAAALAYTP